MVRIFSKHNIYNLLISHKILEKHSLFKTYTFNQLTSFNTRIQVSKVRIT